MRGKDRTWHIERLRVYADRRWSMAATANVLRVDRKTVAAWAEKHGVDFSGYDRAAAKNRTIWFAMTPMRRLMARLKLLGEGELKNNPPNVSGELQASLIDEWRGLAKKRLWIKLRFAKGWHICYHVAERHMASTLCRQIAGKRPRR